MDRLDIDFGPASPHPGRVGRVLLLAALGVALAAAGVHLSITRQAEYAQARLASVQAETNSTQDALSPGEALQRQEEEVYVRQVAQQLSLPWAALFDAVEAPDYDAVTLVGIAPSAERKEVQIEAEANDLSDVLRFVRQLRQSGGLQGARLVTHEVVRRNSDQSVRFKVVGTWSAPHNDQ